jgi:SAM-dependent methyltransferase
VKRDILQKVNKFLEKRFSVRLEHLKPADKIYQDRFEYQKENVAFDIAPDEKVLDIGSGNNPFPFATHLVDLYDDNNFHRGGVELVRDGRPMFKADIASLPFRDKEFDFVYCSHVLEHVNDPRKACGEIMRVGKRGYIETPTRTSDMLYNFSYLHRWYVNLSGSSLIFIEYSDRERQGTGSSYFFEQQLNSYRNEVKKVVYGNRTIFCNMFLWDEPFSVYVFNKEGNPI